MIILLKKLKFNEINTKNNVEENDPLKNVKKKEKRESNFYLGMEVYEDKDEGQNETTLNEIKEEKNEDGGEKSEQEEKERLEKEKILQEILEKERIEQEKFQQMKKTMKLKKEKEKQEKEKLEKEKEEKERIDVCGGEKM